MADFSCIPVFTDALLADTSHLDHAEFGLYFRLLMLMWRTPGCRVPNDITWLQRRLNAPEAAINAVLAEFCNTDGNWWVQKRLQKEFKYVSDQKKRQSVRAKSRWNKDKDACHTHAAPHQSGNAPTPSPSPTPTIRDITKVISKGAPKKTRAAFEADSLDGMEDWFRENAPGVGPLTIRQTMLDWCDANGKTYKDYYAALRTWAKREQDRINQTKGSYNANGNRKGPRELTGHAALAEIGRIARQRADIERRDAAAADPEPARTGLLKFQNQQD